MKNIDGMQYSLAVCITKNTKSIITCDSVRVQNLVLVHSMRVLQKQNRNSANYVYFGVIVCVYKIRF